MLSTKKRKTQLNSLSYFHKPVTRIPLKVSAKSYLEELNCSSMIRRRDVDLLLALNEVGLLSRHQIQRLFFPSESTAKRRLRLLYKNHLLDCGSDDWFEMVKKNIDYVGQSFKGEIAYDDYGLQKCFLYTPDLVGQLVIYHYSTFPRDPKTNKITFQPDRYHASNRNNLTMHDLWISEAYVQLRLASEQFKLPFEWRNEALSIIFSNYDLADEIVRPDATYVTELAVQPNENPQQFARFIEMDRGSTKWESKVKQYNRAHDEGNWQKQFDRFPLVLCVVPEKQVEKVAQEIRPHLDQVSFYVISWPDFLKEPTRGWTTTASNEQANIIPSHYFD